MTDSLEQPTDMEREMVEGLAQYINEKTAADEFSGAVLVTKDGKSIFQSSVGFANKEKQIPNKINTKFNLGSCNKMFTGVAIAQLVERGLLAFDDNIGKALPDYPNKDVAENVTIHQLLTHTSGLGHYLNEKYMVARPNLKSIDAYLNLFIDEPLLFRPGENVSYSGNGFTVLGKIIEALSGQSYYDFVRENIHKVANMPRTDCYEINPENISEDMAIGYTRRLDIQGHMGEGERKDNRGIIMVRGDAGGGGYPTCPDLVNFGQALLGHKLLSPEMTKVVLSPHVSEGSSQGRTKSEGYGFQVWDEKGVKRIGHPGRFAGVNARFDVYPDLGYTVVVLANYDEDAAFNVAEKATAIIAKL